MSDEGNQEIIQTLGNFLREQRDQKGSSLAEIADITRISLPVLKAIEEDDYAQMPADAFCRGFYSIYANVLGLDPQEIIERYTVARGTQSTYTKKTSIPPAKESQKFKNYAEPSSISPATSMTFLAATCLVIAITICWYFKFNPIDYVNNMLVPPQNSVEKGSSQSEPFSYNTPDLNGESSETISSEPLAEESVPINNAQQEKPLIPAPLPSESSENIITVTESTTEPPPSTAALYHLKIIFNNSGMLKVTLDDGFVLDKHFEAGETLQWDVQKKIILDMPESLDGTLSLNGIGIPLPEAANGRRLLSLPEDLLD